MRDLLHVLAQDGDLVTTVVDVPGQLLLRAERLLAEITATDWWAHPWHRVRTVALSQRAVSQVPRRQHVYPFFDQRQTQLAPPSNTFRQACGQSPLRRRPPRPAVLSCDPVSTPPSVRPKKISTGDLS